MVCACDEKRGPLRIGRRAMEMKVRGEGREEDLREDSWTKYRMI